MKGVLMDSIMLATDVVTMVQKFYPEYLAEKNWEDTPLLRAGFYMAAVSEIKETPLPDPMSQDLVLKKLQIMIKVALKAFEIQILACQRK